MNKENQIDSKIEPMKENDLEIAKEVKITNEVEITKVVEITKEIDITKDESINKEVVPDYRNAKEKLYDKIPISVKALDIFITICVVALIVMIAYFVIRRYL